MYTIPPTGGLVGGVALVASGGSLIALVAGVSIILVGLALGVLLLIRERRRRRYLATLDHTTRPMYRRGAQVMS